VLHIDSLYYRYQDSSVLTPSCLTARMQGANGDQLPHPGHKAMRWRLGEGSVASWKPGIVVPEPASSGRSLETVRSAGGRRIAGTGIWLVAARGLLDAIHFLRRLPISATCPQLRRGCRATKADSSCFNPGQKQDPLCVVCWVENVRFGFALQSLSHRSQSRFPGNTSVHAHHVESSCPIRHLRWRCE
jgi:hypothetical protein